jgi:predicted RNA binding protein YcfA (HicA-like mRNA interferase family)
MTSKQMIQHLQDNGFNIVSQKATSHVKLYNPETKRTVIVPMHGKDLKKGLEHSILKQAGLK